jgi:hypothetical protein
MDDKLFPSLDMESPVQTTHNLNRLMGVLLVFTAMLLVLLIAGLVAGVGQEAAVSHPKFAPMQQGIDAGTLGAPVWTGYTVGLLIIGMLWVTMQVGVHSQHWLRTAISVWTISYVFVFIALMIAYDAYEEGKTTIVAGFTEPVAWLVYGVSIYPWIPLLMFTYAFKQAYFGPEEQARFDEILVDSQSGHITEEDD